MAVSAPKTIFAAVATVVIAVVALVLYLLGNPGDKAVISNFEECAAAGYPIMESFPERCATPDGRSFTKGELVY